MAVWWVAWMEVSVAEYWVTESVTPLADYWVLRWAVLMVSVEVVVMVALMAERMEKKKVDSRVVRSVF